MYILLFFQWRTRRIRASVSVVKKSELFNVNDNHDDNRFLPRYRLLVVINSVIVRYRPTPSVGGVSVIKLTKNNRVNKIKHYSDWKNSVNWFQKFSLPNFSITSLQQIYCRLVPLSVETPIRAFRQIYQTKAFSVTQGSGKFARAVWFAASVKFHSKALFPLKIRTLIVL